jgi:hypothetical protein
VASPQANAAIIDMHFIIGSSLSRPGGRLTTA